MVTGRIGHFTRVFTYRRTTFVEAEFQFSEFPGCTEVQPHSGSVQVCNASELGRLDDHDEHASGSSSKDDNVLGQLLTGGDCKSISDPRYKTEYKKLVLILTLILYLAPPFLLQ